MYSAIEKLQKFFNLETERGYDNRAVVGGLDKILPSWEKEARDTGLDQTLIQAVSEQLNAYERFSLEEREAAIHRLLEMVSKSDQTPSSVPESRPSTESIFTDAPVTQPVPGKPASKEPKTTAKSRRDASLSKPHSQGPAVGLYAPLTVLSGIGKRHAQTFQKLGINTLADLMYYFPRRYDDYSQLKPINRLEYGEEVTVIAQRSQRCDSQNAWWKTSDHRSYGHRWDRLPSPELVQPALVGVALNPGS